MLTTRHRQQLEKAVKESSGKDKFSESYIMSRDLVEILGRKQYVLLFVDVSVRDDIENLDAEMVKPVCIDKEWLDQQIYECDQMRADNIFSGISFMTTVEDVPESSNEEEAAVDLVMNHYGPWDFLKLFFISLFK